MRDAEGHRLGSGWWRRISMCSARMDFPFSNNLWVFVLSQNKRRILLFTQVMPIYPDALFFLQITNQSSREIHNVIHYFLNSGSVK